MNRMTKPKRAIAEKFPSKMKEKVISSSGTSDGRETRNTRTTILGYYKHQTVDNIKQT